MTQRILPQINRPQLSSQSKPTTTPSGQLAGINQPIPQAIAWLCSITPTLKLTPITTAAWNSALSSFPQWVVFRAVIRVGLSKQQFVQLGDLFTDCSETMAEFSRYGSAGYPPALRKVAAQAGIPIDPPPQQQKAGPERKAIQLTKPRRTFREARDAVRRIQEANGVQVEDKPPAPSTATLSDDDRRLLEEMTAKARTKAPQKSEAV